jgi:hypothetical protein
MLLINIFMYDHLHILKLRNVAEFPGDLMRDVSHQVRPHYNVVESGSEQRNVSQLRSEPKTAKVGDIPNLFFNKTYNLSYGMFRKLWNDYEIVAVKEPSFIKKVNYKTIVKDLFETLICKDPEKDKAYKKIIANTNYGLLEKHINRRQRTYIFSHGECKHYQSIYGGEINYIQQYEVRQIEGDLEQSPLDEGIGTEATRGTSVEYKETGEVVWVLNLTNSADMTNGFRYIKELLIQYHNAEMQSCLRKLADANVSVYSVKTDAFTIAATDLTVATDAMDFGKDIGQWRVSKEDEREIKFPGEKLVQKSNREIAITEQKTYDIPLTEADEWETDKLCNMFEEKKKSND